MAREVEINSTLRCPIASEYDTAAFVAFIDDVVEVFESRGMQRVENEVSLMAPTAWGPLTCWHEKCTSYDLLQEGYLE
jgi:hypothetical protein